MLPVVLSLFLGAGLAGCATASPTPPAAGPVGVSASTAPSSVVEAMRRPGTYLTKKGATAEVYEADINACLAEGKAMIEQKTAAARAPYTPGMGGAIGSGIAAGIARGLAKKDARDHVYRCMDAKGYAAADMTPEQRQIYASLDSQNQIRAGALLAAGEDIAQLKAN